MDVWEQIKDRLSTVLPWESFQSWLARTEYHGQDGRQLLVQVPNRETKDWIEREYSSQVREAVAHLRLPFTNVVYMLSSNSHAPTASAAPQAEPPSAEHLFAASTTQLNPRYTFQNFVVGSCNQLAHAAAQAVADRPAGTYNPLFIYGGPGMGKTHLLHAIGNSLQARASGTRIVPTTSERFVNQLVTCIRNGQMSLFHQYYRTADVLLIDDVHILAGRERTQEEFFHTFNELYDHQKQIVLTSDSSPKQIQGLHDRLRSRFEWGLLADVHAPDLETKLAILDKKANLENLHLPDDVRVFIATRTKSNVRELEGALIKLIAVSSMTHSPITLEMAKQSLKSLSSNHDRRVTVESVIKAVAERMQLQPSQLRHRTNARNISYPRQIAMYIAKELTPASLPELGRAFGGKHHTTVLHSIQKIERERHSNPDLNKLINNIIDSFN